MKKIIFTIVSLFCLSNVAMATSYKCNLTQRLVGAPTYLIILADDATFPTQAVILSQNMSTGSPDWSLISGNAEVARAPDGGPLSISSVDHRKVDWTQPETKDQCYVQLQPTYYFRLSERSTGVTGTVTYIPNMNLNPHKTGCPQIYPASLAPKNLSCKDL